jgi:hypothetical protein
MPHSVYSECVSLGLETQHAVRIRLLSSVACPSVHNFSTVFYKRHDFRGKKILDIKCVLIFSISSV